MIGTICRLATQDCLRESRLFFCFAVGLAAVLAPLLVLLGLKHGIIDTMLTQLRDDPRNREVIGVGNRSYDADWFARMQARPDVAFIVPRTRSIAASIFLDRADMVDSRTVTADLVPSGPGDPLLGELAASVKDDQIVLAAATAQRLRLQTDDIVHGWVVRTAQGGRERVTVPLRVVGIVPPSIIQRDTAYVSLGVMLDIEDYRDGFAVPGRGWAGTPRPERRVYSGYRLFARTIFDVAGLERDLIAQGLETRTRAEEIETVMLLDANLSIIFAVIAGIAGVGYALSLASSLWANVERKRPHLSVLRLIGFTARSVVGFPLVQAQLIAAGGAAMAIAAYFGTAFLLNSLFAARYLGAERLCYLMPQHFLLALAATAIVALLASVLAGLSVLRIDPAEGLRHA